MSTVVVPNGRVLPERDGTTCRPPRESRAEKRRAAKLLLAMAGMHTNKAQAPKERKPKKKRPNALPPLKPGVAEELWGKLKKSEVPRFATNHVKIKTELADDPHGTHAGHNGDAHARGGGRKRRSIREDNPLSVFNKENYEKLKVSFREADTDKRLNLSWQQVQGLAETFGIAVDFIAFKRIDRDRSGMVDWEELLRLFYPRTRALDIRQAIKMWGDASPPEEIPDPDPTDVLSEEALAELRAMFTLYATTVLPPATGTPAPPDPTILTKMQLRHALAHNTDITDGDLDQIYQEYTEDGTTMNFKEFAGLMENVASIGRAKIRNVQYHFVKKPIFTTPDIIR